MFKTVFEIYFILIFYIFEHFIEIGEKKFQVKIFLPEIFIFLGISLDLEQKSFFRKSFFSKNREFCFSQLSDNFVVRERNDRLSVSNIL